MSTTLAQTQPAPLMVEWITDESAGRRLGITTASVQALCEAGKLRHQWHRPAAPDKRYPDRLLLWVWQADVIALRDAHRDPRQPDPLAGYRRNLSSRPRAAAKRHGRDKCWDDRPRAEPAALYGLLTIADARELARRRELLDLRRRAFPLPVLPTADPVCPDCRRALLIELHTRREAAAKAT